MSKRILVASYCEPDKWSLNWQLHALYLSYLEARVPGMDFLVTIPEYADHLIDPRMPRKYHDPIHRELVHPALEAIGLADGYVWLNHFLAVEGIEREYDYILLTDVDTLLLPSFRAFEPVEFLVGRGAYSTSFSQQRLREFSRRLGFDRFGAHHNLSATWYGLAATVIDCARRTRELLPRLIREEDWSDIEWPRWWIGVAALYASEIVINEYVDHLTVAGETVGTGIIDAAPRCQSIEHAIHLHMYHHHQTQQSEAPMEFSKHAFERGVYDLDHVALTGDAKFALDFARAGRALVQYLQRE